jgi:arylsulfatase A-like enzyme/cytochrome c-type biogenesis protein CcmH/NrfG
MSAGRACWIAACLTLAAIGCGGGSRQRSDRIRPNGIVLITIDTLRADRVGAYGWRAARTPAIDALAARGVRFDRAYATAPITLPSHASLLTGLYPPKHGARHNGMHVGAGVATLASTLHARGFATGAFVAAFPLDHRFGLDRGFDVYSDTLPRGSDGRPLNERPGSQVVDEALAWLNARKESQPFFLWVHLFEPHAPYEADPGAGTARSQSDRYDDEVARADRQVARLVAAVEPRLASTLLIIASDHGEAFGEHGEVSHSLFVYDTTLRVPLVMAGAALPDASARSQPVVISAPVSLVDVSPTVLDLTGLPPIASDGVSLRAALDGRPLGTRTLYAESFAPLLDFGWSPLRTLRDGNTKYIAAPRPELYDVEQDPGELHNLVGNRSDVARQLSAQIERITPADLEARSSNIDREAHARLGSLGYVASAGSTTGATRPDPKDRVEMASRIAAVMSGELRGDALRTALQRLVADDPRNGQMQMRLGFALLETADCGAAVPHFDAAIAAAVPSADPYLGLAECLSAAGRRQDARRALVDAERVEPGNPVVAANLGMLALEDGRTEEAIDRLSSALRDAPDLHQARFALARAYGRAGRRAEGAQEARELLARLPADAPQRVETLRLLAAFQ